MKFAILFLLLVGSVHTVRGEVEEEPGSHLFILSGQSNMTGPLARSFRHCVEQTFGGDKVIVVRISRPSQPIKQWYKDWQPPEGMVDEKPEDNGKFYEVMIDQVQRAVKDRPIATTTFVWMQGEADAVNGWGSVYARSFQGVLDRLKEDFGRKEINFVVGRINEFWLDKPDGKRMREVLANLGEENSNGDWIDTDDLNRGVNPWGGYSFEDGHYPPAGYRVMGQRFAKKACGLIDPELELDPALFEEVFFDAADDIATHLGVGGIVTGPAPEQRDDDEKAALSALTDGKFATLAPADEGWLAFAPSDEPIVLTVDLGSEHAVDSIAVHTLIASQAKAEFPKRLVYSTSTDGERFQVHNGRYNSITFYDAKLLKQMRQEGIKPRSLLLLTDQQTRQGVPNARYVRIEIQTGEQWVYLDEIVINPKAK